MTKEGELRSSFNHSPNRNGKEALQKRLHHHHHHHHHVSCIIRILNIISFIMSNRNENKTVIPPSNPRFQLSWCKFQFFTDCYGSDHRLNHQGENACRQTLRCKGNQTLINLINTHETSRIEGSQVDKCKGYKMYICDIEHTLILVKARRKR